jgi:hypothetical protein
LPNKVGKLPLVFTKVAMVVICFKFLFRFIKLCELFSFFTASTPY